MAATNKDCRPAALGPLTLPPSGYLTGLARGRSLLEGRDALPTSVTVRSIRPVSRAPFCTNRNSGDLYG